MSADDQRQAEQHAVDLAYQELDRRRRRTRHRLTELLARPHDGTPAAVFTRDAEATRLTAMLAQLEQVEDRLVFGRVDSAHGTRRIGRLGLVTPEQDSLLVDWRAEAAREFYQATAARPGSVRLRRHITLRRRVVTHTFDDLVVEGRGDDRRVRASEAAVLAVVDAPRGDRMYDVVATLHAEQDRIIRAPLAGVLVVQGAPGTGKTAVALHRAAYLLHAHRDRLADRGMLLVGPNDRFLAYVSQVLPSLGEDAVESTTVADLVPGFEGVLANADEPDSVAALKGDPRMATVLAEAVTRWPRVPARPISMDVDGDTVWLRPDVVRDAQRSARETGDPHNVARDRFCEVVLDDLVRQLAEGTGETLDDFDSGLLRARLHAAADVRREVNLCWMPLDPPQVLMRLWSDPARLRAAADGTLTGGEQALLSRGDRHAWTPADLPLLDELADVLGPLPRSRGEASQSTANQLERRERVQFARDVVAATALDPAWVDVDALADRYAGPGPQRPARVGDPDRTWGHVVVDEAQDLSPMEWRVLLRRCPSGSMTVVGDIDQATAPGAAADWRDALDGLGVRWRLEELGVNYRTPGTIARLADQVLGRTSRAEVLRAGRPPVLVPIGDLDGATLAAAAARTLRSARAGGTVAMIVPEDIRVDVSERLGRLDGGDPVVSVLTPDEAKGHEFDHSAVVEPAAIVRQRRGRQALYVALTRATQTLTVLHTEPLPAGFEDLEHARSRADRPVR